MRSRDNAQVKCLTNYILIGQTKAPIQRRTQDDFWGESIWSHYRTYSMCSDRKSWANIVEVYIIFLFLLKNLDCRYSLDRGGSKEYPQSMFWAEI